MIHYMAVLKEVLEKKCPIPNSEIERKLILEAGKKELEFLLHKIKQELQDHMEVSLTKKTKRFLIFLKEDYWVFNIMGHKAKIIHSFTDESNLEMTYNVIIGNRNGTLIFKRSPMGEQSTQWFTQHTEVLNTKSFCEMIKFMMEG